MNDVASCSHPRTGNRPLPPRKNQMVVEEPFPSPPHPPLAGNGDKAISGPLSLSPSAKLRSFQIGKDERSVGRRKAINPNMN